MRNPKLLFLLRQGCTVTFPSGVVFIGWPTSNMFQASIYILGTGIVEIDTYDLTEEGIEKAILAEIDYAKRNHDDKELALQERKEEM